MVSSGPSIQMTMTPHIAAAGERILTTYDVRYIVLYKNMPDRPTQDYWSSFEDHPNLYRTAFENGDVLIVERR